MVGARREFRDRDSFVARFKSEKITATCPPPQRQKLLDGLTLCLLSKKFPPSEKQWVVLKLSAFFESLHADWKGIGSPVEESDSIEKILPPMNSKIEDIELGPRATGTRLLMNRSLNQLAAVVQNQAAIRFYDLTKNQLHRVISAPDIKSFDFYHWAPNGQHFAASNKNQLFFWDLTNRFDWKSEQNDDQNEQNRQIQEEIEFYQAAQENCTKDFDAKICSLTLQGSTVIITLENGKLLEVFYDPKRRYMLTTRTVELSSQSEICLIGSKVQIHNEKIFVLTRSGALFTISRKNNKVYLSQTDPDCHDFIYFPNPEKSGDYLIPIGQHSCLKLLYISYGNIETIALFEHDTKVVSHAFHQISDQSNFSILTCGTASGNVVIWKIVSQSHIGPKISKSDPTIISDPVEIQVKECKSARSLAPSSISTSRVLNIRAANQSIKSVELLFHPEVTSPQQKNSYLAVTYSGKIQIWRLLETTSILSSVIDTGKDNIIATAFPSIDGFQRIFYLPENSRILHMKSIGISQLSQLTSPGAVGQKLAHYGFTSARVKKLAK